MGRRLLRTFSVCLFLLFMSGCRDDGRLRTYPVNGKVVFEDGQPLRGGSVICLCESGEHALSARGNIGEDGTFTLGTYDVDDGAIAGQHLVAIDPPIADDFNPDAGPAPRVIADRFRDQTTSELSFEINGEGTQDVTLTVSKY